jgi:anthranilate phosphoribosyltransferase
LVSSYTHPEYAESMQATLQQTGATGLLLRGTEGEAVADARRSPAMTSIYQGAVRNSYAAAEGSLESLPDLPTACDAETTARYIEDVLNQRLPIPQPIALQLERIVALAQSALTHTDTP